jgi:hypothetical protein
MTEEDQKGAGEHVEPLEHLQRCSQRGSLRGNNIIYSRKVLKVLKKPTPRLDSPHTRAAAEKWPNYRNLLRRLPAPAKGRGRLQRQINRCFVVFGPEVSSSRLLDWCYARNPRVRQSRGHRWSLVRVLDVVAERVGHSRGPGRPWLWRLKQENTS